MAWTPPNDAPSLCGPLATRSPAQLTHRGPGCNYNKEHISENHSLSEKDASKGVDGAKDHETGSRLSKGGLTRKHTSTHVVDCDQMRTCEVWELFLRYLQRKGLIPTLLSMWPSSDHQEWDEPFSNRPPHFPGPQMSGVVETQSKDDDPRRERIRELSRLELMKYQQCRSRRGVQ